VGVTPLEMAVVYATLADGGYRNTPIAVTKVTFPDGQVDDNWGQPHRVKVLSEAVTAEETNILHQNVLGGTAVKSVINCPTAAKTGTTSELRDAWLDGYNPEYATVVWMGYPNKAAPMTDVHGEPQQGGALPAVIWKTYMSAVTEGKPCPELPTTSKEPIEYKPFYGHYATTGEALAQQYEAPAQQQPAGKPHKTPHGHHPSERAILEVQEEPAPKSETPQPAQPQTPAAPTHEPATPPVPSNPATPGATGGAAPP
jgi:membrane peptidoglycan carboxypeptidase